MKEALMLAIAVAASSCTMMVNNRSQVHYVNQRAEYDGKIKSDPADSSSGNSVNAERTTEAAVNTSSGSASVPGKKDQTPAKDAKDAKDSDGGDAK